MNESNGGVPNGHKRCKMCGEIKPLTAYRRMSRGLDGYNASCLPCLQSKQYDEKNKRCPSCGEVKPKTEFFKNRNTPSGTQVYCKVCLKAYKRKNPYKFWAYNCTHSHKNKGYKFLISHEELESLARATSHCPICDCEMDYSSKIHLKSNSPSLDRKYNGKRLTLQNTWIICWRCNAMKQDLPMPELVEWCRKVIDRFGDVL